MMRIVNVIGTLLVMGLIMLAGCGFQDPAEVEISLASVSESSEQELKEFTYAQLQMAMPMRLTVWCESEAVAQQSCKLAFARAAELVKVFSDYDPSSEVNQLLACKVGVPCAVSDDLFEVLAFSKQVCFDSNNAFDPTTGTLVGLWRLARESGELPVAELLRSAKAKTGFENVVLDFENQTVTLLVPGIRMDFGGVAKGYIGDQVVELLREQNVLIAKYQAGGDVVVGDPPPNSTGWPIEVFGVDGKTQEFHTRNCGVSTSGDLKQFVQINGVRYSHVVDPRTGKAVATRRLTVVVATRGMYSDAIATAGCVLDEDEFQQLLKLYDGAFGWSSLKAR